MDKNNYFIRTRGPLNQTKNKSKLLSTVLRRIIYNRLTGCFDNLKQNSENYIKKLSKVPQICKMNLSACKIYAWEKIKIYCTQAKSKQRILKDIWILLIRVQTSTFKNSFQKLKKIMLPNLSKEAIAKLAKAKKKVIWKAIKKLYTKSLTLAFQHLKQTKISSLKKLRLLSINTLTKSIKHRNLLHGWLAFLSLKLTTERKQNQKLDNLNYQLQDMKIQIQNKNNHINRLQEQLTQLKSNIKGKQEKGDSFYFNNSMVKSKSNSFQRSISKQNQSFQKQSSRGNTQRSKANFFAQLLGIPTLANNQNSNKNILVKNKIEQCACTNCNYLERYEKNKMTYETLKKQLELIKIELEFTKDMNQHLEGEMRNQLFNQQRQQKMEKLRIQIKQSYKEKQCLREKVYKHQKYISKLKQQFKNKIEQIYRKVKKNS